MGGCPRARPIEKIKSPRSSSVILIGARRICHSLNAILVELLSSTRAIRQMTKTRSQLSAPLPLPESVHGPLQSRPGGQREVAVEAIDACTWAANGLVEFLKAEPRISIVEACTHKLSRKNQFSLRRARFAAWFLKPFNQATRVDDIALCCIQRRIQKAGAFSPVCHQHQHQRPETGLILIPVRRFFNQGSRWATMNSTRHLRREAIGR